MKLFWIIIIISFFAHTNLFAQSIEQTIEIADQQYNEQKFESALEYYKRVLFFDKAEIYTYIHHRLANCYLTTNKLKEASFEYNIAYNLETNDSIKNEIIFKIVLIQIIQNNFSEALQELLALNDTLTTYFDSRRNFYHAIIELDKNNINSAKNYFIISLLPTDSIKKNKIEQVFLNYHPNKPNVKLAKTLSIILPGLGQLYIGDYKNAANSFLLTGSLATLFIIVAINYTFIDAAVAIIPVFYRYYQGGIKKVGTSSIEKRYDNKQNLLNAILYIFSNN